MRVTKKRLDAFIKEPKKVAEEELGKFLCAYIYRLRSSGLSAATVVRRLQKVVRQMLEKGE